jgi:indolepyruvate ferredoxin oxidoreductase alpha subunit
LKLGCVWPLPDQLLTEFCKTCGTVYVIEDLDPFIETHCKALGLAVHGKDTFPMLGEFSQGLLAKLVFGETKPAKRLDVEIPGRPPVLCAGCPHRGLFFALKRLQVFVSGDIGCYTLGALAPLSMMDTCVCMGASVSALHGRNKASPANAQKSVAVIGDSTFLHSGVTGLMNIAYNQSDSVVIILDNSITGMTGHQQNPATGVTLKGDPTAAVDLEALCKAVGVADVRVVDPYDLIATETCIKDALQQPGPSVVIARRRCVLLKNVKHNPPLRVDSKKCVGCKQCMRIGCPAISIKENKAVIDRTQCVGCDVCKQMCKFDAIKSPSLEGQEA